MHRLSSYGENLVTTSMKDSHFDHDYQVTTENNGIKFAFALTAYDNNTTFVDESEYGHVSAMHVQWGIDDDSYSEIKIPTRICTSDELGLGESE